MDRDWQEFERQKHEAILHGIADSSYEQGKADAIKEMETQFSTNIHSVKDEMAQDTHPDAVLDWRLDQFIALGRKYGFKLATAQWLAKTRIELRRFEKYLEQGCKPEVAIKIMDGTCFAGDDERRLIAAPVDSDDSGD